MSKADRLLKKIKRLEEKKANLNIKIYNLKSERDYWLSMEDDSADWKQYEDYD